MLAEHLIKKITECTHHMKNGTHCSSQWTTLCQASLAYLILFNYRCVGEVQKLELLTYVNRNISRVTTDISQGFTKFEHTLAKVYERIEIRGTRSRKIALLLPRLVFSALKSI